MYTTQICSQTHTLTHNTHVHKHTHTLHRSVHTAAKLPESKSTGPWKFRQEKFTKARGVKQVSQLQHRSRPQKSGCCSQTKHLKSSTMLHAILWADYTSVPSGRPGRIMMGVRGLTRGGVGGTPEVGGKGDVRMGGGAGCRLKPALSSRLPELPTLPDTWNTFQWIRGLAGNVTTTVVQGTCIWRITSLTCLTFLPSENKMQACWWAHEVLTVSLFCTAINSCLNQNTTVPLPAFT